MQDSAPSTTDCRPQPTPWPQPFWPSLDGKKHDKAPRWSKLKLRLVFVAHPAPVPSPASFFNQSQTGLSLPRTEYIAVLITQLHNQRSKATFPPHALPRKAARPAYQLQGGKQARGVAHASAKQADQATAHPSHPLPDFTLPNTQKFHHAHFSRPVTLHFHQETGRLHLHRLPGRLTVEAGRLEAIS